MSNATPVRVGQVNAAGDVDAIFLKVFGGEVLASFESATKLKDRVAMRTISSGKSASFPRYGTMSAAYHTPGNEILGTSMNFAEVVITIDDLLLAHSFIANIDEAKAHYDVRGPVSSEMGRALAKQWDKHLLQLGCLTARASNVVTGLSGGTRIGTNTTGAPGSANFATNGSHIASAMFLAKQILDEKDVPEEDRVFFVRPAQFQALASTTGNINKDWGSSGSFADGTLPRLAGFEIVQTNNLPSGVVSNGTVDAGTGNRYAGTFTNTTGLFMHKSALATVKLMDLAMESQYDIRRQGHLFVAKYAVGHGGVRPEAAVELVNAAV